MIIDSNWQCRYITPGSEPSAPIPAAIPGCLTTDLLHAGILPDPFFRDNAERIQWIENCDAIYTCRFTPDQEYQNPVLTFLGLDVYASIRLNGTHLGETDNMFRRWSFPVKDVLLPGENILEVRFTSPIRKVQGMPSAPSAFTCERLHTRRIQCTYGWDWVGRFVSMGIWRPVILEETLPDTISSGGRGIYITTQDINPYAAQIRVCLNFEQITGNGNCTFTVYDPKHRAIFGKTRRILSEQIEEIIDIPNPQLWYPAGYGEQPLYLLKVVTPSQEHSIPFGIRKITLLQLEDQPGSREDILSKRLRSFEELAEWDHNSGSSCFILLCNGIRIFCQGADYVPCEPFPSEETPEKINHLIKLARFAGVNMLRVWGGGIFEHSVFYHACDREGILVTQDFLMACGHYPEKDNRFLAHLRAEAAEAALDLRNHPCLAWWSGDNENAVAGSENRTDYPGRAAAETIEPVLKQFDPGRRFLPSSPYGGDCFASSTRGTTHNTQFLGSLLKHFRGGDFSDYQDYLHRFLSRFCSEQPAFGMPFKSSLRKFMTEDDIIGHDQRICEYHTKNNPDLEDTTIFQYAELLAKGIWGDFEDGEDRLSKLQMLHCEWVRQSFELFRRNQWYSSGLLYWMWNDCWPAAISWSLTDYYGCAKPALYMFHRCAQPFLISIDKDRKDQICVIASYNGNPLHDKPLDGFVHLYRYNIRTGKEDSEKQIPFHLEVGETRQIYTGEKPKGLDCRHMLLADASAGQRKDRAYYYPLHPAEMDFEKGTVEIAGEDDGSVTVFAPVTIPVMLIDTGDTLLSDNGFFLKRGEWKTLEKIHTAPNGSIPKR